MEIYEVLIGNIPHHVQLDEETAKRTGAKLVTVRPVEPVNVPNKARTGKVRARGSASNPVE